MNKFNFFKRATENNSDTSSVYSNIFMSKKISITFLNRYSNDIFNEKINNTLQKTFFNRSLFDYELYIILMLEKINLTPRIVPEILEIHDGVHKDTSRIIYNIDGMISLRETLEKNSFNFHYLINELLSFLKTIQHSKLLIGNLNIDTIYVGGFAPQRQNDKQQNDKQQNDKQQNDKQQNDKQQNSKIEFYIVDFTKANFTDRILDLDIQSLYISLNENNVISQKNLNYFDQEFERYISKRLSKESFTESIIDLYNN